MFRNVGNQIPYNYIYYLMSGNYLDILYIGNDKTSIDIIEKSIKQTIDLMQSFYIHILPEKKNILFTCINRKCIFYGLEKRMQIHFLVLGKLRMTIMHVEKM